MNDPGKQKLHYRETESMEQLRSRKLHIYLRELLIFILLLFVCLFVFGGEGSRQGNF